MSPLSWIHSFNVVLSQIEERCNSLSNPSGIMNMSELTANAFRMDSALASNTRGKQTVNSEGNFPSQFADSYQNSLRSATRQRPLGQRAVIKVNTLRKCSLGWVGFDHS